jgi:hypothetical protein
MNIFVLHQNPSECAKMHANCHVCKMITETAQMLSTALHECGQSDIAPYKPNHVNHPCSVWARESLENWVWLRELGKYLYQEYKYRYNNKTHKAGEVIMSLYGVLPDIEAKGITPFSQALPEQYRDSDAVKAYRRYYLGDKKNLLKYTKRSIPEFIIKGEV